MAESLCPFCPSVTQWVIHRTNIIMREISTANNIKEHAVSVNVPDKKWAHARSGTHSVDNAVRSWKTSSGSVSKMFPSSSLRLSNRGAKPTAIRRCWMAAASTGIVSYNL